MIKSAFFAALIFLCIDCSADGSIILEQIGKSWYFRISGDVNGKNTVRCMEVTSLIDADEFIRIADKIEKSGYEIIVNRPAVHVWEYRHGDFGTVSLVREWKLSNDNTDLRYKRYDITINGYTFIYYLETIGNIGASNIYDIPDNQSGSVYVRIIYGNFFDSVTDEELLVNSGTQIEKLRGL